MTSPIPSGANGNDKAMPDPRILRYSVYRKESLGNSSKAPVILAYRGDCPYGEALVWAALDGYMVTTVNGQYQLRNSIPQLRSEE